MHLQTLVGRGFVRPNGDGLFGFRHVLVQEAVYRSAPKRLRAELHERCADRLDRVAGPRPTSTSSSATTSSRRIDLRTELGETNRRTERLAEEGGTTTRRRRIRALKRGDMPATMNLLGRATSAFARNEQIKC